MSFSFNDIKYGWKIIAGVVITGATIFVADNTRQQILQRDTIQPILGTHERCLSAGVAPLEFVRTWTSNVYDTSGVTVYTNIVTNAIGWRVDRAMLVALDAKIEELAPYFADTNTVYDGTTNIVMNTFTGLLTSLDIGDHTNFTAYGWYISQDDLKERYKVLETLKWSAEQISMADLRGPFGGPFGGTQGFWIVKNIIRKSGTGGSGIGSWEDRLWSDGFFTIQDDSNEYYLAIVGAHDGTGVVANLFRNNCDVVYSRTNLTNECSGELYLEWKSVSDVFTPSATFKDLDGLGVEQNKFKIHDTDTSTGATISLSYSHQLTNYVAGNEDAGGYGATFATSVLKWDFSYATNKFW